MHRQINIGPFRIAPRPPSWNPRNQQAMQGGGRLGQEIGGSRYPHAWFFLGMGSDVLLGVVKAFVNRLKNTTNSASTLTNTPPVTASPSATSNQLSPGTSKYPSNLLPPTSKGTSNQDDNKRLGPLNGTYPIPPPPICPTSSGSSVLQISNNTNPDLSQTAPNPA